MFPPFRCVAEYVSHDTSTYEVTFRYEGRTIAVPEAELFGIAAPDNIRQSYEIEQLRVGQSYMLWLDGLWAKDQKIFAYRESPR